MPWHKDSLGQVLITIQDDSRYSSIVDPRNVLAKAEQDTQKTAFLIKINTCLTKRLKF